MKGSSSTSIGVLTWEVQLHLPRASLAYAIFRHWLTAFSSIASLLRHRLCCAWAEMGGSESWVTNGILPHQRRSWIESLSGQCGNILLPWIIELFNSTAVFFFFFFLNHPPKVPLGIPSLTHNVLYRILNAWKCSKRKQIWNRAKFHFEKYHAHQ